MEITIKTEDERNHRLMSNILHEILYQNTMIYPYLRDEKYEITCIESYEDGFILNIEEVK